MHDPPEEDVVELDALAVCHLLDVLQRDRDLHWRLIHRGFPIEEGGQVLQQEWQKQKNPVKCPRCANSLALSP